MAPRASTRLAPREPSQETHEAEPVPLLQQIRGCWEFACLAQYLVLFGKAVKIDSVDVEDLEVECMKVEPSPKLAEIGLALLKCVSSHRGLTPAIFDEYARRQYVAKAPERNPFGEGEEPLSFQSLDIMTRIKVLHQLSVWSFHNPNTIRDRMDEAGEYPTDWRIEPVGVDHLDRKYYVLSDSRLYRETKPHIPEMPPPKRKKAPAKSARGSRASRRRSQVDSPEAEEVQPESADTDDYITPQWELIAVDKEEYDAFLETIRKSKRPKDKELYRAVQENVFPILEERHEAHMRKLAKQRRELEALEKLATAKRSSRLAGKKEKEEEQRRVEEAERKRLADLKTAQQAMAREQKMQEARESRMMTREQRIREREMKRVLEEEKLREAEKLLTDEQARQRRVSERALKTAVSKRKRALSELQQDDWVFDCSVCGVHGQNIDDGTHSIACDTCGIWQHSACHGIKQSDAEKEDFQFLCKDCIRKKENALQGSAVRVDTTPTKVQPTPGSHASGSPAKKSKTISASPNGHMQSNVTVSGKPSMPSPRPAAYPGAPPLPPPVSNMPASYHAALVPAPASDVISMKTSKPVSASPNGQMKSNVSKTGSPAKPSPRGLVYPNAPPLPPPTSDVPPSYLAAQVAAQTPNGGSRSASASFGANGTGSHAPWIVYQPSPAPVRSASSSFSLSYNQRMTLDPYVKIAQQPSSSHTPITPRQNGQPRYASPLTNGHTNASQSTPHIFATPAARDGTHQELVPESVVKDNLQNTSFSTPQGTYGTPGVTGELLPGSTPGYSPSKHSSPVAAHSSPAIGPLSTPVFPAPTSFDSELPEEEMHHGSPVKKAAPSPPAMSLD
ncbi:hypothetical protein EJ06DRAFT_378388 [Trichodelitschia bisporula]|uniref:Zinc finger PHD-type domain-containing protein n=1 Tax=Trichodelitschia bisporula TaxID=703511 RepID=A0A6G1HZF6_9PEZI|nr:hypothetical protein EJ06DRAFT_378388 [Trichodelitschia bisporula]